MPAVMMFFTFLQFFQDHSSNLQLSSISFSAMKIMEYSLRSVASEMLFVSLDYDCRFFGKEVINVLGNRLGKSGMAICMVLITSIMGKKNEDLESILCPLCNAVAFFWLICSYKLKILLKYKDKTHTN
mmetsp:Transcript_10210/g.14434  ORF Transcript_10210/g.14434 Transcript_10210/m.14434 type:complete len:128 (+) Transcript_10210:120-503(+)